MKTRTTSTPCLALLGYGRFGAALGGLAQERGFEVRALDPSAAIPEALRASTLHELIERATFIVVAVPLSHMRTAFRALAPLVQPGQIVLDVGSVKIQPTAEMNECFGERIPWVATHPLFGPTSLTLGERPLRVVVCETPQHPEASARVRELFQALGCQVQQQTPDEHDRHMAWTQALAFFVAKGLLDAGAPVDAQFTTPSFQAIARTVAAVRSDAGHLFTALHRENPHAAEARKRLLNALHGADQGLLEAPAERAPGAAPLDIPDLGEQSPDLRATRELIDELDRELFTLLERRAQLASRAQRAKARIQREVYDPEREASLLEERRRWASQAGLNPDAIERIFQAILRFSRELQGSSF